MLNKTKNPHLKDADFGGDERIRTVVDGFADRCLATRPRRHYRYANLGSF